VTLSDGGFRGRRVASGRTRESAAAAVGPAADDLYLTTHADLALEVDLDKVTALDLVADEGYEPVLAEACRRLRDQGAPALRVAVCPGSAVALAEQLDSGGVTITGAETVEGSVVLTLAPRAHGDVAHDGVVEVVLSAIDAAANATPVSHARTADRVTAPAATATRVRPRSEPQLLGRLAAVRRLVAGPRRRAVVLGGLGLVVVALLLLGIVPDSPRALLTIALPLVVVLLVVGFSLAVYTQLLLARQVHAQTGRIERMLLRNREVVHERATAIAQRLDGLEETQARLPFLEEYVETLAETSAATSTRLRDLLERLEVEDARSRD
jgi:hypothetical protein